MEHRLVYQLIVTYKNYLKITEFKYFNLLLNKTYSLGCIQMLNIASITFMVPSHNS